MSSWKCTRCGTVWSNGLPPKFDSSHSCSDASGQHNFVSDWSQGSSETSAGQKFDGGKLRYDLDDPIATAWRVGTLTYGVTKYAANNWRLFPKEELREKYGAAMERHFQSWKSGEDFDEETGFHHLAMAQFSLMVLVATFVPGDMAAVRTATAEAIRRWKDSKK